MDHHALGAAQRFLDLGADGEHLVLEVGEVALEALFVVAHPGLASAAAGQSVASTGA